MPEYSNIQKVNILVGKQLGFSEADSLQPANLSASDRIKLFDYSFKYVADNPSQFEPRQVQIAKQHVAAWGIDKPLEDTSFDWALLGDEMANNALKIGESVASVGQGVMNTLNLAKWVLPLAGLTVVGILLYKFYKK